MLHPFGGSCDADSVTLKEPPKEEEELLAVLEAEEAVEVALLEAWRACTAR